MTSKRRNAKNWKLRKRSDKGLKRKKNKKGIAKPSRRKKDARFVSKYLKKVEDLDYRTAATLFVLTARKPKSKSTFRNS